MGNGIVKHQNIDEFYDYTSNSDKPPLYPRKMIETGLNQMKSIDLSIEIGSHVYNDNNIDLLLLINKRRNKYNIVDNIIRTYSGESCDTFPCDSPVSSNESFRGVEACGYSSYDYVDDSDDLLDIEKISSNNTT